MATATATVTAMHGALRPAIRTPLAALRRGHAGCSGHGHGHHAPPSEPKPKLTTSSPPAAATARAHAATASARAAAAGAGAAGAVGAGGPAASAAYCADLVRRLDPDAWLTSYFWPGREKQWWLAVRAFNIELHLVSTSTTQPTIAAMRFQFWRDALSAIFTGDKAVPQHPVAQALAEAKRNRPIMKYYLSQLIEVRAKSLTAPPAEPSLEAYLGSHLIPSALLQGSLPLLLPPAHEGTAHISHTLSHVAHLLAVSSLLHALPHAVARKQLPIPADVCAQHGVTDEDVFRHGAAAHGFRDAVFTVATRGMDELITARTDLKRDGGRVVPSQTMPLFLSAVPAERWLKRLEEVDFDVFSPQLQKHDWKLAPAIWWRYQRGRL